MELRDLPVITHYRNLTLDDFQRRAIAHIEAGRSVLVSAPTGTGKTLVADYVIEKMFRDGRRVVYTAPIKALSNQKYKEFKALLGEAHVGILTGDIVINPEATVLIMTTEIFRNLLHVDVERLADVGYVVFDEIHYIDDPVRGSVWEESLIFMPPAMRFLGLSATIPNCEELAAWAEQVHGQEVAVVRHDERAVPLSHHLFERQLGLCTREQLLKRFKRYAQRFGVTDAGRLKARFEPTTHLDLIEVLKDGYLPCLYFTFSRRRCEIHASELGARKGLLASEARAQIAQVIERQTKRYNGVGESRLRAVEPLLMRGIAYHHAGLLPLVKDVVEELFESRLLEVLYCTETFAVGINFPCKSVCFDALTKWDGERFRALYNREYFQMAGRAGRRGIDSAGYVFTCINFNFFSPDELPTLKEADVEPLQSRFTLSYNTVLNLVRAYRPDEIANVLQKNFATYQSHAARQRLEARIERVDAARRNLVDAMAGANGAQPAGNDRRALQKRLRQASQELGRLRKELARLSTPATFLAEFEAKRRLLAAMAYLEGDELTGRGEFAAQINGQDLLITELFFDGLFHDFEADEINALTVAIDYEPRKSEVRPRRVPLQLGAVRAAAQRIARLEEQHALPQTVRFNEHLCGAALKWSRGAAFNDVLAEAQVDEGDLVYAFRRTIDTLRQLRAATREDAYLQTKLRDCTERMDRGEVSILL